MSQYSLYYRVNLQERVPLTADQLDGSFEDSLLENLRKKVIKKTIDRGIVMKVEQIIDYSSGMISTSNFMATTVFDVTYEAIICAPTAEMEIVGKFENIVKGYLLARNGPVIIAVQLNNLDTNIFRLEEQSTDGGKENGKPSIVYLPTQTTLKEGDLIRVNVINTRMHLKKADIMVIAKLTNIAEEVDIAQFHQNQKLMNDADESEEEEQFI